MSQSLVLQSFAVMSCSSRLQSCENPHDQPGVTKKTNLFLIIHLACCCQKEMLQFACLCQNQQYFAQTTIAFGMPIPNVLLNFHANIGVVIPNQPIRGASIWQLRCKIQMVHLAQLPNSMPNCVPNCRHINMPNEHAKCHFNAKRPAKSRDITSHKKTSQYISTCTTSYLACKLHAKWLEFGRCFGMYSFAVFWFLSHRYGFDFSFFVSA